MKIKLSIIGLVIAFVVNSCSKTEPIGKWDDSIMLSQKEIQFLAKSSSIVITTIGESWWFVEITLNGLNFDLSGIDTSAKNLVIDEAEFRIERKNTTEIHIEMTKNTSGSERVLIISLEAGNYFDAIRITQLGV